MADVIHNNPDAITLSSRAFSALQGGRFNASKSHGALYCSEHPLLSTLEVTYHTVVNALADMRRIGKLERQYSSAVNLQLPKQLHFLIAVFVLDAKVSSVWEPDLSLGRLKATCDALGYGRYTSPDFDTDFIFGNDYGITQIFGSHALASRHQAIRVGTARLAEGVQFKNLVILDRAEKIALLREYYLFEVKAEPGTVGADHEISIERIDRSRGNKMRFTLANVPVRPSRKSSCVRNYPRNEADRIEKSRQVIVQKFSTS